jgi:hypothetical protein
LDGRKSVASATERTVFSIAEERKVAARPRSLPPVAQAGSPLIWEMVSRLFIATRRFVTAICCGCYTSKPVVASRSRFLTTSEQIECGQWPHSMCSMVMRKLVQAILLGASLIVPVYPINDILANNDSSTVTTQLQPDLGAAGNFMDRLLPDLRGNNEGNLPLTQHRRMFQHRQPNCPASPVQLFATSRVKLRQ